MRILSLNAFHYLNNNFNFACLETNWWMSTVELVGIVIMFTEDIPVHMIMEKLQGYWPDNCDELIEILGIYLKWRMHQLIDGKRRFLQIMIGMIPPLTLIFIRLYNDVSRRMCKKIYYMLDHKRFKWTWCHYTLWQTNFSRLDERAAHLH